MLSNPSRRLTADIRNSSVKAEGANLGGDKPQGGWMRQLIRCAAGEIRRTKQSPGSNRRFLIGVGGFFVSWCHNPNQPLTNPQSTMSKNITFRPIPTSGWGFQPLEPCRDAMTEAGKGAFLPDKEPEALRTITKNHETRPPR